MATNQSTPVILTEADILELEVRPYDEVYARPFNKRTVRLTVEERDALVETVRAAWARIAELERTALNEQKKRLVRFLSKQGYAPCTEPDHDCDGWHERLTP